MNNLDKMLEYIQQDYKGSLINYDSSYFSINEFSDEILDTLWYRYHDYSFQAKYRELSNIPFHIKDKSFDNMMQWYISLSLKINNKNIITPDEKKDTNSSLNNLCDYDEQSSLIIYTKNGSSFILNFIRGLRNSFAHGGLNVFTTSGKHNVMFLSANSKQDCIDNGFNVALRIIDEKESKDSIDNLFKTIKNILISNITFVEMFLLNLKLSGYVIVNKEIQLFKANEKDSEVNVFYTEKNEKKNIIFCINEKKAIDVKQIILDIITKNHFFDFNFENKKICFYLENTPKNSKKDSIIDFCKNYKKKEYDPSLFEKFEFNIYFSNEYSEF